MKYHNAVPVIATSDVQATIAYYVETLDFEEHFTFGNPPVYAGIKRDDAVLYITLNAELAALLKISNLHPEIFLWVRNIDLVFEAHIKRGVSIVEEISDRAWDARQYVIEDPNGYHLKIAESIDDIRARSRAV